MKEIKIIVTGATAVGKSTMVLWLEKQLKKKGFLVEIDLKNEIEDYGNETQFRYTMDFERKKKLKRIKDEVKITLMSMQMKNALIKNENTEETKTSDNK
jgi:nucleoside-triphosphatase THEP1